MLKRRDLGWSITLKFKVKEKKKTERLCPVKHIYFFYNQRWGQKALTHNQIEICSAFNKLNILYFKFSNSSVEKDKFGLTGYRKAIPNIASILDLMLLANSFLQLSDNLFHLNLCERDLEEKYPCLITTTKDSWVKYFSFQGVVLVAIGWSCNLTRDDSSSQPTSVKAQQSQNVHFTDCIHTHSVYFPSFPWHCC